MTRTAGAALVLALAGAGLACRALNYLDPAGPAYVHHRDEALARAARPKAGPLRVVTFNIEYGIEVGRALDALRSDPNLRGFDVLALQEMDDPGVERIALELGVNSVYFPSGVHPKHDRDFGCAILSPWPLEDVRKVLLPHGARGSGLRRAAVVATVVRGQERFRFYSVHLPSPLAVSGGSRREELRVLAADAKDATTPVVIAGDFNSHGKCEELVKAGLRWITRDIGSTARFSLLGIPLFGLSYDHVLTRGYHLADVSPAMGVADNHGASDHRPVFAVLARD
jgi:endonuclease/exonuclease/phosphatase family metal-dependent hydrolase